MVQILTEFFSKVWNIFSRTVATISTPPKEVVRKIIIFQTPIIIILTLIPIINIAHIILTSGENNLSNDVVFWIDIVDKFLQNNLDLKTFIVRSFFTQYFVGLYIGLEMLNARLFGWSIQVALFFGFFLNVIKLALLFDLFTFRFKNNPFRWLALPFLSAMVFSNMEVGTFTGENTSILIGMSLAGAVISIWGIARFPNQLRGVFACILGGLISTWTFGLGLVVWPITLFSMLVLSYKKIKYYLIWFFGAVIGTSPYLYFFIFKPGQATQQPLHLTLASFLNFNFIINLLGRPLVKLWTFEMISQYMLVGAMGVFLALACFIIFLVSIRQKQNWRLLFPPTLISTIGLSCVWLASTGRTTLADWYITIAWPFWLGIVGFNFILLLLPTESDSAINSSKKTGSKLWAIITLMIIGFLYARSNIGNPVYGFFLYSRTPASASCLRDFQNAPTYCESFLFQWPIQRPEFIYELGQPLATHQLSVNSQQQQWSLQGDYILERVETVQNANTEPIGWFDGLSGKRISRLGTERWRHLDLLLQSPNSLKWTLDLPEYTKSAVLITAVGIHQNINPNAGSDGLTFSISISGEAVQPAAIFEKKILPEDHQWIPVRYDLSSYRGKKITIQFSSLPGENNTGDLAMFQYPVINFQMARHPQMQSTSTYTPENTDLWAGFQGPGPDDISWNGKDADIWNITNLTAITDHPGSYLIGEDPQFQLKQPVNLCLADFRYFFVEYSLPPGLLRVAQIFYQLDDNQPLSEEHSFSFTTIGDGQRHVYTYPVRLLDLDVPPNTRLINIRFDPTRSGANLNVPLQFERLGLIKGTGPSACQ